MLTKREVKRDLVHAYQILSYLRLDDHTYTHLSARSEDQKSFYIYPFGIRFNEVNGNSLMKVSFDVDVIEGKEYQYNKTGYIIHGFIYQAGKDIKAIFHLHYNFYCSSFLSQRMVASDKSVSTVLLQ